MKEFSENNIDITDQLLKFEISNVIESRKRIGNDIILILSSDFSKEYKSFIEDFLKYYPELEQKEFLRLFSNNEIKIKNKYDKEEIEILLSSWEMFVSNIILMSKIILDIEKFFYKKRYKVISDYMKGRDIYNILLEYLKEKLPVTRDILDLYLKYERKNLFGKLSNLWKEGEKIGLIKFKKSDYSYVEVKYDSEISIHLDIADKLSNFHLKINYFLDLFSRYTGKGINFLKAGMFMDDGFQLKLLLDTYLCASKNINKHILYDLLYGRIKLYEFMDDFFNMKKTCKEEATYFGFKNFSYDFYYIYLEKIVNFYKFFTNYLDSLESKLLLYENSDEKSFNLLLDSFSDINDIKYFSENGLFDKISGFSDINKKKFVDFFYEHRKFFKKYIDFIKSLDEEKISLLIEFFKLGFNSKQVILLLESNFSDISLLKNKRDFAFILLEKYPVDVIKYILKLDDNIIRVVLENNISPNFVKEFVLKHQKLFSTPDDILKFYRIQEYKKNIFYELNYLPRHYSDKEKILGILNNINLENFGKLRKNIEKIISNYKATITRVSRIVNLGYSLEEIEKFYDILLSKKTKKNKIRLSSILDILEYVVEKFDNKEVKLFFDLLSSKKVVISPDFLHKYETIIKLIIKNNSLVEEYLNSFKGNLYLTDIEQYLKSEKMSKLKDDLIINLFPEVLYQEARERKNNPDFDNLIKIAKIFDLKNEDENLVLELIIMDNKKGFLDFVDFIKKYIKSDIKEKFMEVFGLYKYLEESKKDIFDYLNQEFLKTLEQYNEDIKYWWLNEFIYGSLGPEFFFKEEDFEDEDNEKIENKGLSGLGGFTGKEVLRKLKKIGFKEKKINGKIQGKGDHILLFREKDGKKQYFLVPMHRQVKASTLGDKLKMVGISKDEFLNA